MNRCFAKNSTRTFGAICIRISDPRLLGLCWIDGADESVNRVDSSVPLMHHDLNDLGSLILIQITHTEHVYIITNLDSRYCLKDASEQ